MDTTKLLERLGEVLINPAILLLFGVALVFFVYGLVRFLWEANVGGKDNSAGKQHMIWGVVGMFVMVAAWGIIKVIENTLNSLR